MSEERGRVTAERLRSMVPEIAEVTVERHHGLRPELHDRYGAEGRQRCLEDARFHLDYLEQAIRTGLPEIFTEYVRWGKSVLTGRGIPADHLRENLECLHEVLGDWLPHDAAACQDVVAAGIAALGEESAEPPTHLTAAGEHQELARAYLDRLLAGERREAGELVLAAAEDGVPVRELYLQVFQPVQREVGRLWQLNRITVAHEHYCTAATQLVMSRLYPLVFSQAPAGERRPRMVATCAAGELHEIGVRMVADLFELDGWDCYYLGANTPRAHLLAALREHPTRLLAVSASLPSHLEEVRRLVAEIKEDSLLAGTHVMVGGRLFSANPSLGATIGADGVSGDVDAALATARSLLGESR